MLEEHRKEAAKYILPGGDHEHIFGIRGVGPYSESGSKILKELKESRTP